jgi:hypothetical protein
MPMLVRPQHTSWEERWRREKAQAMSKTNSSAGADPQQESLPAAPTKCGSPEQRRNLA